MTKMWYILVSMLSKKRDVHRAETCRDEKKNVLHIYKRKISMFPRLKNQRKYIMGKKRDFAELTKAKSLV
jgi:hypothetical protein